MNSAEKSNSSENPDCRQLEDKADMKAIDFLRQEHHKMLCGLHGEIERLQKQCADMQRRLICHGILPSNEEALEERLAELDSKLAAKYEECEGFRVDLDEKTKVIEGLEERLQQQEERYREDVSARNLIVVRLRKEVQEKANSVSRLVTLLRTKPGGTESQIDLLLSGRETLPFSLPAANDTAKSVPKQTGNLYKKLMNFGPASNQNLSSSKPPQPPTLTISKQIMDRYCQLSSTQNGNSTTTRTFKSSHPTPQTCQPRVQLKHDDLVVDCLNNVPPWPGHLLNGKEASST